jgi:hypothetical protein
MPYAPQAFLNVKDDVNAGRHCFYFLLLWSAYLKQSREVQFPPGQARKP